jgi:thiamine-phosphate pyrophosphorylase
MTPLPRLYVIADASFGEPIQLAEKLFEGGARLLQLRNKKASAGELLDQAERICRLGPPDARIIVNDRADVALVAGAAGVHLGQTDLAVVDARRILGAGKIIGVSTHNLSQALEADALPVDYIAVGPIFPTVTKQNPDPVVGVENLAAICAAIRKPVVAIGGITLQTAAAVLSAGASSIAVVSDLLSAEDISSRVRHWRNLLDRSEPRHA